MVDDGVGETEDDWHIGQVDIRILIFMPLSPAPSYHVIAVGNTAFLISLKTAQQLVLVFGTV